MKTLSFVVKKISNIHVRPAGELVKIALSYKSDIIIKKGKVSNSLKNIVSVISMNIKFNDKITLTIEGEDEDIACCKIREYIEKRL